MLVDSTAIYLITGSLMLVATLALIWAVANDQLRAGPAQAAVIFDAGDLQTERAWETLVQRAERQVAYGEPCPPGPGEWGGAQ